MAFLSWFLPFLVIRHSSLATCMFNNWLYNQKHRGVTTLTNLFSSTSWQDMKLIFFYMRFQ